MIIRMILRHWGGGLAFCALAAACTTGGSRNGGGSGAGSSGGRAYGSHADGAADAGGTAGQNDSGGASSGSASRPIDSGGSTGGLAGSHSNAGGTAGRSAPGGSVVSNESHGFQSGTRLRARFVQAASGEKEFLGWYDRERSENCTFVLASDGRHHCMPTASIMGDTYFADAKCTVPLFARGSITCVIGKLYGGTQEACGTLHLYELSEVTPRPDFVYAGTMCGKLTKISEETTYYAGTEIAPSAFVGAIEKLE